MESKYLDCIGLIDWSKTAKIFSVNSHRKFSGISRGIDEKKCGNFRGQLKKKQNFQWH